MVKSYLPFPHQEKKEYARLLGCSNSNISNKTKFPPMPLSVCMSWVALGLTLARQALYPVLLSLEHSFPQKHKEGKCLGSYSEHMLILNDVQRAVDPSLWRLDPCVPGLAASVGILPSQARGYMVLESTVPTSLVPFLLEPATHGQAEHAEKSSAVRVPSTLWLCMGATVVTSGQRSLQPWLLSHFCAVLHPSLNRGCKRL